MINRYSKQQYQSESTFGKTSQFHLSDVHLEDQESTAVRRIFVVRMRGISESPEKREV